MSAVYIHELLHYFHPRTIVCTVVTLGNCDPMKEKERASERKRESTSEKERMKGRVSG